MNIDQSIWWFRADNGSGLIASPIILKQTAVITPTGQKIEINFPNKRMLKKYIKWCTSQAGILLTNATDAGMMQNSPNQSKSKPENLVEH